MQPMYFSKDGIIERKLRQLKRFIPDDVLLIPQWSSRSAIYLGGSDYGPVTADEKPFCIGDTWECYDNFTRWSAAKASYGQMGISCPPSPRISSRRAPPGRGYCLPSARRQAHDIV